MNFDSAFDVLLRYEGGLSDDPQDPGGLTKYGISQRAYPNLDITNLTVDDCKVIYKRDYWGPACCDSAPDALKYPLFSMAVNSGVRAAVKALQTAAQVEADGVVGPITLMAIQSMDPQRLVKRFMGARLQLMANAKNWPVAGRGWALRVAGEMLEA